MSLSTKFIFKVFDLFRFTLPKLRLRWSVVLENRVVNLSAKKVKNAPDFNKKFKELVRPYWKQYKVKPHKNSFKVLCAEEKPVDPRYIPNGVWFGDILCHYNNLVEYINLGNKSLQPLFVPDLRKPETVIQKIFGVFYDGSMVPLTEAEACTRCRQAGKVIVKQSYASFGGKGVCFVDAENMTDNQLLAKFNTLDADIVVQRVITQHEVLRNINPTSINTIRILTFFHKGEVHVLSAVLRMGSGEAQVDNITQGGFACRIHDNGQLDKYAISRKSSWNTVHPGGTVFGNVVIPNYSKIIETVKSSASKVPYFKIIGWDIAVGEDGEPIFIEFNVRPEQNQKTCGPTFGDMTD